MNREPRGVNWVRRAWFGMAAALVVCLCLAALVEAGGRPAAIDWRAARAVAFESDDWGLCGFFPEALQADDPLRAALTGRGFPSPYWQSTLEDSCSVAELAALLGAHVGRDGRPAVLQANYIVSALHHGEALGDAAGWQQWDLPELPPPYRRPGLWCAVDSAIAQGVWRPELHGAFHYDPQLRRQGSAEGPTLAAARRGILLFPGSERAWELGHWRNIAELEGELTRSLAVFRGRFGRVPVSVCAPDYVWDGRCEALWERHGLRVIQAKREQRYSAWRAPGVVGRALKVLARIGDRICHPGRTYLDRNCRFEPAQRGDLDGAVAEALAQVRRAWRRGEPAIIETHRVNFVSLDPVAAASGRAALARLLEELTSLPEGPPLFLTDDEVAQLARNGASWSRRGAEVILRNLSHGTRWVAVASPVMPAADNAGVPETLRAPAAVLLPPNVLGRAWPSVEAEN